MLLSHELLWYPIHVHTKIIYNSACVDEYVCTQSVCIYHVSIHFSILFTLHVDIILWYRFIICIGYMLNLISYLQNANTKNRLRSIEDLLR